MKSLTQERLDITAAAIRVALKTSQELQETNEALRSQLETMEDSVNAIIANGFGGREITKLKDRVRRLQELRNIMELGAFKIGAGDALDETWRKLP